ncbi:hypothetical protein ACIPIC_40545 [Streptomyces collinus]|uniref:hypothetical protein n=1 Tax=Streptomyces collinus TaxID=42684 RepID=UPI00380F0AF2
MLSTPVTASASASARPTGCTQQIPNKQMTVAKCSKSNGGHYRAVAACKDPDDGRIWLFYGEWRNDANFSTAYCGGATKVQSAGLETKVS